MSNLYPQQTYSQERGRNLVARRSKELRKRERRVVIGALISSLLLSGGLLARAHSNDVALAEQQTKAEQAKSVVVGVSSETIDVEAKTNDIVGTLVEHNSHIINEDPANIKGYVAFDAAVDEVEAMPENKDVLADGTLQVGEHLIIPKDITVTTEAKINQGK